MCAVKGVNLRYYRRSADVSNRKGEDAVPQFEFSPCFIQFLTDRHLEGRKASPRCHQRASSPERPFV